MKKRVWMTEEDYKALTERAKVGEQAVVKPSNHLEEFALEVIQTFGLSEAYPTRARDLYSYGYANFAAQRFIKDVRDASKHAAAKDAVKRLRGAVKESF